MKTSIVGFPRVGSQRELKFASEKYFRNEITKDQLLQTAKSLRKENFEMQKETGLDFIPSNDFSFYDNFLDIAFQLNVIPERYKSLGLSPLDTYFAMARGYQGEKGDVKALAMKKWFNTNYHYMVAEIDDNTEIRLTGTKIFDEFSEAMENGAKTKPCIIGAFTFLKLAKYTGEKSAEDFVSQTIRAYVEIVDKLN